MWHVRGNLNEKQTKPLARRFAIRMKWKMKGRTVDESEEWVKHEVRRHVVAELEALFGKDSPPAAASSNEGVGAAELNAAASSNESVGL